MTPEDLKQIRNMISEGFEQVVLPVIQDMQTDIVEIKETLSDHTVKLDRMEQVLDDHTFRLDRMERMVTADIHRTDEHSIEIKRIKKHIGMK